MRHISASSLLAACLIGIPYLAQAQTPSPFTVPVKTFAAVFTKAHIGKRGEFETTDAFMRRVQQHSDTSLLAFSIPQGDFYPKAYVAYDADKQVMTISVNVETVHGSDYSAHYFGAVLADIGHTVGSYVGSNAYGARRRVTNKTSARHIVASPAADADTIVGLANIEISLPPDSARRLKPTVRVYIVGRLIGSPDGAVATEESDLDPATLSNPTRLEISRKVLWMDPLELWVVDGRRGVVLAKRRM